VSGRRALLLVARRELTERARQRSFQISSAVTVLIVAAVAVASGVIGGGGPERYEVAAQGDEARAIVRTAREIAPQFDARVKVRDLTDRASVSGALDDDELDAVVDDRGTIVSDRNLPDELEQLLQVAARQVRTEQRLSAQGLSAAEIRQALDPPALHTRSLSGSDSEQDYGVALLASFLLYGMLIIYGVWVATGVVEEKSSRVIEVLLAAVPARALLTGKVVGLGLLGLGQLLVSAVVGLGAAAAAGAVDVDGSTLAALAVALVWFLLGYALYAWLYAATGSLVSRQEDMQSATTPLTLVLVLAFVFVFPTVDEPDSPLSRILSIVPFTSPLAMPARVAQGEASPLEIAASLGLLVATTALLIPLATRIYEGAVLRTGRPVKFAEAWRAARG
jgi:ABC-2 type transport system permease protein